MKPNDIHVRLPEDLAERIRAKAKDNFRTLNGEVIWALAQVYRAPENQGEAA